MQLNPAKLAQLNAQLESINKGELSAVNVDEEFASRAVEAYENGNLAAACESMAQLGSVDAMFWTGFLYASGTNGAPKDERKGFQWMKNAAEAGHPEAMFIYGGMLFKGEGTEQNFPLAFSWIKKSAEAGNVDGMTSVGVMYIRGQGVIANRKAGLEWLVRAAANDSLDAMMLLGQELQDSDNTEEQMFAFKMYLAASKAGEPEAINSAGYMLYRGIGDALPRDSDKAKLFFERAAEEGHITAMKNLATILKDHFDDEAGYKKWYRKAADAGDDDARQVVRSWNDDGFFRSIFRSIFM